MDFYFKEVSLLELNNGIKYVMALTDIQEHCKLYLSHLFIYDTETFCFFKPVC